MDRAYINYAKLEKMAQRGVIYVIKIKNNFTYNILNDTISNAHFGIPFFISVSYNVVISRMI